MVVSEARIEANKRNSIQSTGPKTPDGKAVSRANAFKHGLTGDGIVVPNADIPRIAKVAKNLRDRHKPTTIEGHAMIDRAAMLLVRLDRAGLVEVAIVEDSVLTAIADFDQFRIDWADDLFQSIETNPAAVDELQTFPEGIDRLIAEWTLLATIEEWTPENLARLGRISDAGKCSSAVIRSMIPGEIGRLEDIKAGIDRQPIEAARKRMTDLALFPTTPEAILARRYEAATERAYHKAMKTFHEAEETVEPPILTSEPAQATAPTAPVASFSPEPPPPPTPGPQPGTATQVFFPVDPTPPVDRSKRPDPRKLREARRKNRR